MDQVISVKWALLVIALLGVIPISQWLRSHPRELTKVWIFIGFMPLGFNPSITPVDWSGWPGYVFGLQITALDLMGLALLPILRQGRFHIPFRYVFGFYVAAIVLSIFPAQVPMAAVFYAWQIARVFMVYTVIMRACTDENVPTALLTGLTIGLCYQAVLTVWQRFGLGILQTGGSFGDKNLLGLASGFAIFPAFALLLAGKREWYVFAAPIAGIIVAIMTTSRAAVGLAAIGLVLMFVLSSLRGWTQRKARVLLLGTLLIVLVAPISVYSFQKRFSEDPLALEYDERAVFENAASMMLGDHPFGVGANNYVVVINQGGYADRAGIPWGGNQRRSLVHNVYWLMATEAGYLGVVAIVLLLLRIAVTAFRSGWRAKDMRGDMLLGLGVSMLVLIIHSKFEWVFVLYPVQYIFAITGGMVAGLATQLGYFGRYVPARQSPNTAQNIVAPGAKVALSNFRNKDSFL